MAEPSPLSTVPPTVLVVDDEKNIRRTLEMVLTGEGYRVLEAESGEKALETLGNPHEPVDVAIFDLFAAGSVPADHRSLAFHVVYRDPLAASNPDKARTLTDAEVDKRHASVEAAMKERFGAKLRA